MNNLGEVPRMTGSQKPPINSHLLRSVGLPGIPVTQPASEVKAALLGTLLVEPELNEPELQCSIQVGVNTLTHYIIT